MEFTKVPEDQHMRYDFSSEVNRIISIFQDSQYTPEADGTKTITLQDNDKRKEQISLHTYLSGIEDKTILDTLAIKLDLIPKDSNWIVIDHFIHDKELDTITYFRLGFDEEKWKRGNFTVIRYGEHEIFDGNNPKGEKIRNIKLNQNEVATKLQDLISLLSVKQTN